MKIKFIKKEGILYYTAAVLITMLIGVIYNGFNKKPLKIEYCSAYSQIKKIANHSQDVWSFSIEDGSPYVETDYWSVDVSKIYFVAMQNDEITDSNIRHYLDGNIYKPVEKFDYDQREERLKSFDGYDLRRLSEIRQHYSNYDFITISNKEYTKCINRIGETILVKYWYGLAYGE